MILPSSSFGDFTGASEWLMMHIKEATILCTPMTGTPCSMARIMVAKSMKAI